MQSTGYESPLETAGGYAPQHSWGRQQQGGQQLSVSDAALDFFKEYARERPEVVAMWAFGIGFILGWKLKPW
jgi:hypothetical protein